MSLEPSDMDDDGDTDVVVSDRRGKHRGIFWLENPGRKAAAQHAAWRRHNVGANDREVMFLDVVNKSNSSPRKIAAALKSTEYAVFTPMSPDNVWKRSAWRLPAQSIGTSKAVRLADIDLDGKLDVVCSCEHASPPKSGVFHFTLPAGDTAGPIRDISGPRGIKFDLIQLHDLDADGDLDVITCEESHNLGVIWYENPTRGGP
jgi:hypothetical protein